jgi:hypothetical protein
MKTSEIISYQLQAIKDELIGYIKSYADRGQTLVYDQNLLIKGEYIRVGKDDTVNVLISLTQDGIKTADYFANWDNTITTTYENYDFDIDLFLSILQGLEDGNFTPEEII